MRKIVAHAFVFEIFLIGTPVSVIASNRSFTEQTATLYEKAQEKIDSVKDNDQYASERFKYIVNKIVSGSKKCDSDECRNSADQQVAALSEAIIKADPSQPYWRPLKLCETSQCAEQLLGPLGATRSDNQPAQTPTSEPPGTDAGNFAGKDPSADAQSPQIKPQIAQAADSVSESDKLAPPSSDRSISPNTILLIAGGFVVVFLWAFFSRRKCPGCGKRGKAVRIDRQILNQHQDTRLKTVRSKATHRSVKEGHLSKINGETVTEYQVPVSTLVSNYLDTFKCKKCDHIFSEHLSETRDV